jgi:hypothetical protein
VTSPLRLVAILMLAALMIILPASVLLFAVGGDWSLTRFALWCVGISLVSAVSHHLFRLDEDRRTLPFKWRGLKQGLLVMIIALVAGFLIEDGVPIMSVMALGTAPAYGILHTTLARWPRNKSLERTREG